MKIKTLRLIIILVFICPVIAYAQKVIAPLVDTWGINEKGLSIDFRFTYKYNSVAVFLINSDKLPDLFTGDVGLSKDIKKKLRLKPEEYPKYLYLYLEIDNPLNNTEKYTFPLYLTDAVDRNKIKYQERSKNIIIDSIPDEALNNKDIVATGKLMTIKGNTTSDFISDMLTITKDLFKTAFSLSKTKFGANEILSNIEKGANFFENISKGRKVENDFPIPILEKINFNEENYKLVSASLHQLRWEIITPDFTATWANFNNNGAEVTIDKLKESINKKGVNGKYCYLLVARYRSKYTLPEEYINKIEIEQDYIIKREDEALKKLNALTTEYAVENNLLNTLRNAKLLKENWDLYKKDKKGEIADLEKVTDSIINSYYEVKEIHNQECKLKSDDQNRSGIFNNYYANAYTEILNKVNGWLMDSDLSGLKQIKKMIDTFFELKDKKLNELKEIQNDNLYQYIEDLSFYRNMIKKSSNASKAATQIASSKVYSKIQDLLMTLEVNLYESAFVLEQGLSIEEKKSQLSALMLKYDRCDECVKRANAVKFLLDQINDEAKKQRLETIKRTSLIRTQCYSEIINYLKKILDELCSTSQSDSEADLCTRYLSHFETIKSNTKQFLKIDAIDISNLNSTGLNDALANFELYQSKIESSINTLIDVFKKRNIMPESSPPCLNDIINQGND